MGAPSVMNTEVLPIELSKLRNTPVHPQSESTINDWILRLSPDSAEMRYMQRAAQELRETDIPVAFPTETVYGLGADATRSSAVQGIYKAKQRPSDNPLIVHFHSLEQLKDILRPSRIVSRKHEDSVEDCDAIPSIYQPLIDKFWPGPLTLIMPNASDSPLASEVTAGLPTFGARIPSNVLALALIKMAGVPLAAPSANASTKPSPTSAEHVRLDLEGRISTILDGGPCMVGVESTVVDGLSNPPVILRPGGISLDDIRACPGWENVEKAYKDASHGDAAPRAPGMKYRHYSPKAPVYLYEHGTKMPSLQDLNSHSGRCLAVGVIRTVSWPPALGLSSATLNTEAMAPNGAGFIYARSDHSILQQDLPKVRRMSLYDIMLGRTAQSVANGLFSALRELDRRGVDAILIEGLDDTQGNDVAAAVMNRVRKAAEVKVSAREGSPA